MQTIRLMTSYQFRCVIRKHSLLLVGMFLYAINALAIEQSVPQTSEDFERFFQSDDWLLAGKDSRKIMDRFEGQEISELDLGNRLVYCRALFQKGDFKEVEIALPGLIAESLVECDSIHLIPLLRLWAQVNKTRLSFDQAEANYQYLVHAYEQLGNQIGLAETYIDLAEFSRATTQYREGLEYIEKALLIDKSTKLPLRMLARLYGRQAALFGEGFRGYAEAEKVSIKALQIAERLGDADLVATFCNELGFIYTRQGGNEALTYFSRAEAIWNATGNYRYLAQVRINIARHYLFLKDEKAAVTKALKVVAECKSYGWKTLEWSAFEIVNKAYAQSGDLLNLNHSVESALSVATTIQEEQHSIEIKEIHAKYRAELVKKEMKIAKAEKALEKAQAKQKTTLVIALVSGVVLLLLAAAALLFLANRNKHKTKTLLGE